MRISAVIFDMDGLMIDTETIARTAWQRAMTDWGYTMPDEIYMQMIGRTLQDANWILCQAFGPDFPYEEIRQRKQYYIDEYIAQNGLMIKPGLLELLNLSESLALSKAVASSTYRDAVLGKLSIAGLIDRFEVIVCGDDVQNGKPAPDIFLTAAAQLGVPAELCMVLEDSEAGVQAAHTAGMIPVMVPDLISPSAETALLAYRVFPSLHEVKPLLEELAGKRG